MTIEVAAMFSRATAQGNLALSNSVAIRLGATSRVTLIDPPSQPFVASLMMQDVIGIDVPAATPEIFVDPWQVSRIAPAVAPSQAPLLMEVLVASPVSAMPRVAAQATPTVPVDVAVPPSSTLSPLLLRDQV